jgi:hypothetical protein
MNLYYFQWTLKSVFCRPPPFPSKKVPSPSKILDPPLCQCSDTCLQQLYDPINNCFCQEKLNQFIINILEPIRNFDFAHLEPALLKGLAGV